VQGGEREERDRKAGIEERKRKGREGTGGKGKEGDEREKEERGPLCVSLNFPYNSSMSNAYLLTDDSYRCRAKIGANCS